VNSVVKVVFPLHLVVPVSTISLVVGSEILGRSATSIYSEMRHITSVLVTA
jgi:hypothetical protein